VGRLQKVVVGLVGAGDASGSVRWGWVGAGYDCAWVGGVMKIKNNSCAYYVHLTLCEGGRWRNEQIKQFIRENYQETYQNNTIAKYLSFMINDGLVLSAPTGGACYEYWLKDQQLKMAI
jgi:hypothetical protein